MIGREYQFIPGRYGITIERTGATAAAARAPMLASTVDGDGALRSAAVLMAIDMVCGMTGGLAVLPDWTVTADAAVQFVDRCTVGPLRVDAHSVRAGRTMSVVDARAVDEGAGDRLVALATANHGVLASSFEHELASAPIGGVQTFARPEHPVDEPLEAYFGLTIDDGAISVPLDDRTTNPWGIFHGGLHGLLVDTAVRASGVGSITGLTLRFLNPVRTGPAVARVVDRVDRGADRLVRVEVRDGPDGRLALLGDVNGILPPG